MTLLGLSAICSLASAFDLTLADGGAFVPSIDLGDGNFASARLHKLDLGSQSALDIANYLAGEASANSAAIGSEVAGSVTFNSFGVYNYGVMLPAGQVWGMFYGAALSGEVANAPSGFMDELVLNGNPMWLHKAPHPFSLGNYGWVLKGPSHQLNTRTLAFTDLVTDDTGSSTLVLRGGVQMVLDATTTAPVPEPATILTLSLGAAACLSRRRRAVR